MKKGRGGVLQAYETWRVAVRGPSRFSPGAMDANATEHPAERRLDLFLSYLAHHSLLVFREHGSASKSALPPFRGHE